MTIDRVAYAAEHERRDGVWRVSGQAGPDVPGGHELAEPLGAIPEALASYDLQLAGDGGELVYTYHTQGERTGITALLGDLGKAGIRFRDLETRESSLEEIFVGLVSERA